MMRCSLCGGTDAEQAWLVVTVLDEEPVGGLICSTGCLIDYAALVMRYTIEQGV